MATFIARDDEGYLLQGSQFCEKIDSYSTTLGLNPIEVTAVKNDFAWFGYAFQASNMFRTYTQGLTAFKNRLRYGNEGEPLGDFPPVPSPGTVPAAVTQAEAQNRFEKLIQKIVASPNYNKTIGEDLGIEAPETPFNPNLGKPELKTGVSTAGHPELKWKKGKFEGIEVWIDTGTGWRYLDKDMRPDFTDKITPLPAPGQSALWKYKAIYLYKGEQVGQWSETVSITVSGM